MNKMRIKLLAVVLSVITLATLHAQTVQDGLMLIHAEKMDEAGKLFKQLAEGTPSEENQYYLGYYLLKENNLDGAKAAFDKGLELGNKSYLNKVGLGAVALGKGNKSAAKEIFDEAEKKKKKDAEVLFRIGEAYTLFEKNTDPAEALRLLDQAIVRDRSLADTYLAKGDALMMRNEGGPAVTAYEYALTAKPNYAPAHNRIGQIYLRGKNYNLALENYKKAIEVDPEFAPAYKDLAELYFLAQQYKKAAENFDLYLQKSGNQDPEMQLRAAKFAFTADDYAKCMQLLDDLKGKSSDPIIKRMYGWSYFKTNEPDKAIETLNEFIKAAPDKVISDDYKYLGKALNLKATTDGKPYDQMGLDYLLKGADLDTSKADGAATYKEVGALLLATKNKTDYAPAASAYVKGIALDTAKATTNDYYSLGIAYFQWATYLPLAEGATDSLAWAGERKNLFLTADSSFAKVGELTPDWPYSYYWRASSLYNAYDRQENIDNGISAPYYEKLAELAEKEDVNKYKGLLKYAYPYLAFYYQTTKNDPARAKSYWEKLLVIDPDNVNAKEYLGIPATASGDGKK